MEPAASGTLAFRVLRSARDSKVVTKSAAIFAAVSLLDGLRDILLIGLENCREVGQSSALIILRH
jgi:hypothetical protein